jgi:alpha-galactosidase
MPMGSLASGPKPLGGLLLGLLATLAGAEAARAEKTVRVFVLAGQSNMVGMAQNGLLESQAADPRFADFWADYRTGDAWTERDDVFITFFNRHGPLTIGYGAEGRTGPELAFGRILGDHFEEPVLLIKTAWGGHSLYKNFRPPSAGLPSEQELEAELKQVHKKQPAATLDEIKAGYGDSYRKMLAEVKRVLAEKDTLFPALAGHTPTVAGLFWFQGFNDQFGDAAPAAYEATMKHFIADVRKDLGAPTMPVVIAGIGTFGWDGTEKPPEGSGTAKVLAGQLAMNDVPEFKGTVKAFETAPLRDKEAAAIFPTWQKNLDEWKKVGSDRPYHYLGSGIWYGRIGQTAGDAMVQLLGH